MTGEFGEKMHLLMQTLMKYMNKSMYFVIIWFVCINNITLSYFVFVLQCNYKLLLFHTTKCNKQNYCPSKRIFLFHFFEPYFLDIFNQAPPAWKTMSVWLSVPPVYHKTNSSCWPLDLLKPLPWYVKAFHHIFHPAVIKVCKNTNAIEEPTRKKNCETAAQLNCQPSIYFNQ